MRLRNLILCVAAIGLLSLVGCFATKFTLIAPDTAKVDRAYIGDWDAINAKGEHASLIIRNIDDGRYYVETHDLDGKNVSRYVGFLASVKNATFAHVRPLQDDGSIPDGWIIMRVELADKKLTLRQLSDDFFKGKPIDSSDQLRQILEANLDNQQLYANDETITATRIAK